MSLISSCLLNKLSVSSVLVVTTGLFLTACTGASDQMTAGLNSRPIEGGTETARQAVFDGM
ncbi:MAG: hypothetical protein AAFO68_10965, partial [Pseudomonadota bacterium]